MSEAEARALLASLPRESRNIPRRSRALVIDRLRAAVEALLSAHPSRSALRADAPGANSAKRAPKNMLANAESGGDVARSLRCVGEQGG